ncbi:MAG: serine hydrolase [Spirochaetales bacterium]|nr:serine hydrolase [Leptospiraceae bacterium]MCP5481304.1 serine hydrolase [Spirochaetales bacterium]MCP5485740.1 serine hydrolase [Spirochaetales bacterium]
MRIVKRSLLVATLVAFAFVVLGLGLALVFYPSEYVYRTLVWQESDAFDWQKFPSHALVASRRPYHFAEAPDARVPQLFASIVGVEDWEQFLQENQTQAFIVVQNDRLVYEAYFNDTNRDTIVTSFSVAKSFTSALIGIALDDGFIESIDDPITKYLPELAQRDPRFTAITIRHLLRMASGLEYEEFRPLLFNSDDVLTTYYPDQRRIALENTRISGPPGAVFRYNKYHPQLLGLILERTTGMSVADYLQTRVWEPLGMEYDGSWSTDSELSDFEKMETGVNARAIDFAKFGALFLHRGRWQGRQLISENWVIDSTAPFLPDNYDAYYPAFMHSLPGHAYYGYMWWGMARPDGATDFSAAGDRGQYIYVSPEKGLVIVRNGTDFGQLDEQWLSSFFEFATRF